MAEPVKKRTKISKESPELGRKEQGSARESKLPKMKYKERTAEPALSPADKKILKNAFDFLCYPREDQQQRVSRWIEINAKKKDVNAFLQKHTQHFPNLLRFKPNQYLAALLATDCPQERAELQVNALCVSQSWFSSAESFQAAYQVVKTVAKGVARSSEELVDDLRNIRSQGVLREHLMTARTDIGFGNQVLSTLLNVAVDLQASELDGEDLAHQVNNLIHALKRLRKVGAYRSAPTGTIDLSDLRSQIGSQQTSAHKVDRKQSTKESPRKEIASSPGDPIKREDKSQGKNKPGLAREGDSSSGSAQEKTTEKLRSPKPREGSKDGPPTSPKEKSQAQTLSKASGQARREAGEMRAPTYTPAPPSEQPASPRRKQPELPGQDHGGRSKPSAHVRTASQPATDLAKAVTTAGALKMVNANQTSANQ